jgi:diaminohydroxyphosphoribosylaminopyrimidine deaminase/5-amino-6-(5-phosphoribosylamino)uracil reductase
MARAISIAEAFQPHPNPRVGCVIVDAAGAVVGEGAHQKAETSHAEVIALTHAGAAARGATVYVTLEPCNHFGQTPPCSDALIAAEIDKVMVSVIDPDQRVAGKGVAALRAAGITVDLGLLESEAVALDRRYHDSHAAEASQ